jgi:hypothetical protein
MAHGGKNSRNSAETGSRVPRKKQKNLGQKLKFWFHPMSHEL